jgi:hypothetical protein
MQRVPSPRPFLRFLYFCWGGDCSARGLEERCGCCARWAISETAFELGQQGVGTTAQLDRRRMQPVVGNMGAAVWLCERVHL